MRWTLAKAGLAMFTASTLGLARPSLAQQSPYLPIPTPTPAGKVRTEAHPYAVVKQHQAMPDEMQVELAWLADPATFPCRLGATLDGDNLKIRGFVPNEAVKMRAMEIAGQHSAMPLIDELRIYANIPMPAVGVAVDSVLGEAAQELFKQLGDKANPLELTASTSGQIVVSGTLPTLADQLAVSHCLWGVHGCTSVKNLIRLPGSNTAATVSAKSSADKKPEHAGSSAPSKVITLPETKAGSLTVAAVPDAKKVTPKVEMPADAKADSPKAESTPVPSTTPSGTEISKFKTLKGSKADASKDTSKETSKTIAVPPPSTEISKPAQTVVITKSAGSLKPAAVSGPTVVLPPTAGSVVAPLSEANQPATGSERHIAASRETSSASASVVAPLSVANQPVASGERKTASPERKTLATDTTSVITADVKMKDKPSMKVEPVSHSTSAPVAKNSSVSEGAYVASGVITYEEAPAPSTPKSHPDSSITRLKDRIQSVCGHTGKNVEVHASSGNRLTIKVQCATREEGERLSKQILELHELTPYEVSLDVKLVP